MSNEHLDAVCEIERLCFADPWSKNSLKMLTEGQGVGFVALCNGIAVAYGGMICVCDEGQITNIATDPQHRRKGLAKDILSALTEYARENAIKEIFLEVRHSNSAAINLYTSFGFEVIGERKKFYSNPTEDAVLMKITLD